MSVPEPPDLDDEAVHASRITVPLSRVELYLILAKMHRLTMTMSQSLACSLLGETEEAMGLWHKGNDLLAEIDPLLHNLAYPEADVLEVTIAAGALDVSAQGGRSTDEVTSFAVGIVGEANFQPAIRLCAPGDRVDVMHEINNPYDDQALVVVTGGGATIGYIAKSSWLRDAIHDEEQGCEASIRSVQQADGGEFLGVVLDVTLNDDILGARAYDR